MKDNPSLKKTIVDFVYFIYKMIGIVGTGGYVPLGLFNVLFRGKSYERYKHRFGLFEKKQKERLSRGGYIWFHAVSVGESLAAVPLIERFLEEGFSVLVSNVTSSGNEIISKKFQKRVEYIYIPFDFEPVISSTIDLIKPVCIVIIETEIWPSLLREAKKRKIPVVMVNGRISLRSFPRYSRFKIVFSEVLSYFSALSMQSQKDLDLVLKIGVNLSQAKNLGNIKFDMPCVTEDTLNLKKIRRRFSIPDDARVICFGSTHQGEEGYAIELFLRLKKEFPNIFLILVPRHPDRASSVCSMLTKAGCSVQLRSEIDVNKIADVLLIDTIGELLLAYSISEAAFVGGSFVPVGGHNILEPASLGKPVIFGPYMDNFSLSRELILDCSGGIEVDSSDELFSAFYKLLKEPSSKMGKAAQEMVEKNKGAVEKNVNLIKSLLLC